MFKVPMRQAKKFFKHGCAESRIDTVARVNDEVLPHPREPSSENQKHNQRKADHGERADRLVDDNFVDDRLRKQRCGQCDQLNRERRSIESGMKDEAFATLDTVDVGNRYSLALFDANWHQGVVGILASRIREKYHRPVIAFARDKNGELKGSGRSIRGFHMRDALDLVTKREPQLIAKFGGHAMAAGLTIAEAAMPDFTAAFEAAARSMLTPADLADRIETDGALGANEIDFAFVNSLDAQVWGQGFAAPSFIGHFRVAEQRVVGERHLKLKVVLGGIEYEAMRFGSADALNTSIDAVFRPSINEFRGSKTLQLVLDHVA